MISHGFEEVEHTADLAIRVWGEDFFVLLSQAAKGMYDLLSPQIEVDNTVKHTFAVGEGSKEMILVDFLNELLFLFEVEKVYFNSFSFNEDPSGLLVDAKGKKVKSAGRYIKAVTFHDLDIHKNNSGFETTITFDV